MEKEYVFEDLFSVDLINGYFTADGQAYYNQKQIKLEVELNAHTIAMDKDVAYAVHDGLWFEREPFMQLSFENNGYLSGEIMDIDILYNFEGTWDIIADKLTLSANDSAILRESRFQILDNDTLLLFDDIEYSLEDTYSSIPSTKIDNIEAKSVFVRK